MSPGRGAGGAPQHQPGLLPQRPAVPGGPRLCVQPGPGPLQAGGMVHLPMGDMVGGGGQGDCKRCPLTPSPAGGHTAAVGPQPGGAADPPHGLHPHPVQPRALCDPQPPLLPPVAPGLTLTLRVLHHLAGGPASLLAPPLTYLLPPSTCLLGLPSLCLFQSGPLSRGTVPLPLTLYL